MCIISPFFLSDKLHINCTKLRFLFLMPPQINSSFRYNVATHREHQRTGALLKAPFYFSHTFLLLYYFVRTHAKKMSAEQHLEDQLRQAEQDIELKSAQMGRLKAEYTVNVNNLRLAYAPKSLPYKTAVYQASVYQQELATRIQWLEATVVAMERQKNSFIAGRDMAATRQAMADAIAPALDEVFAAMEGLSKDELAVMRSYDNPPQAAMATVQTLMAIRGEEGSTWEQSKVIFSETYYYTFFISKAKNRHRYGEFTDEQGDAIAQYVMAPEYQPDAVALISRPCGVFSRWIHLLYQHYLIAQITSSAAMAKITGVEAAKEELTRLRLESQQKRHDTVGVEATLQALDDELHQRLGDLKAKYDDTMVPLQELFFEAHKEFNEAYARPRLEREAAARSTGVSPY